jgi:hypothetical protein
MLNLHKCGESGGYAKRSYGVDNAIVRTKQNPELGFADARGIFHYGLEYWLKRARRRTDDAKHIRCRELLFPSLIQLSCECCELCFLARGGSTTASRLWRSAALWRCRLAVPRVSLFAACSGAPSHCLPQGSGQGIVDGQI